MVFRLAAPAVDILVKHTGVAELQVGDDEAAGLRVEGDLRNEKINYKVREHSLAKVPALLVVGKKEAAERTVSIRRLGKEDQQVLGLDAALAALADEAVPPDMRRTKTAACTDTEHMVVT